MDLTLQKRILVYRKSYRDYNILNSVFILIEFLAGSVSLAAFFIPPMCTISLVGIVLLEGLKKVVKSAERKQEYKIGMKFYMRLLKKLRTGEINQRELTIKESEFLSGLEFLPREKYLKSMNLNGYQQEQQQE